MILGELDLGSKCSQDYVSHQIQHVSIEGYPKKGGLSWMLARKYQ